MNKTAPIIPRYREPEHVPDWRRELAGAFTRAADLLAQLGLPEEPDSAPAADLFGLRVPLSFVRRMHPGDRRDPLLLQVLPDPAECRDVPGFSADPLAEAAAMVAPGLLHKYPGRVLLTLTGACGIHCRYCFRRHYPYAEANPSGSHWAESLEYISRDASIREVILSGGDPLSLSDAKLRSLVAELDGIPHLTRLRIHSRLPVVLPQRVTAELLDLLSTGRLRPVLVIHTNHPNELDAEVSVALRRVSAAGVPLLNQTVLLRGINDQAEILAALSEALFAAGALPYYLHQLDRVQGAAHFEVEDRRACALIEALQQQLPGYLVPRLVREEAGAAGKTPVRLPTDGV